MEIKTVLDSVTKDDAFINWKEEHKEAYLSHLFRMYGKDDEAVWQVGFYCPNIDRTVPFDLKSGNITKGEESEVFKKGKTVKQLNLNEVTLDINEAISIASKLQKEKYPTNLPSKMIVILQNQEENIIYNITFVTMTMKTLNIKINAVTNEVLSDSLESLFQFK